MELLNLSLSPSPIVPRRGRERERGRDRPKKQKQAPLKSGGAHTSQQFPLPEIERGGRTRADQGTGIL